jgi:hypothetical protein
MRVQMLTTAAGPAGVYREGEQWNLEPAQAEAFVAAGAAVLVDPPAVPAVVEEATVAPEETAMLPRGKRGRR